MAKKRQEGSTSKLRASSSNVKNGGRWSDARFRGFVVSALRAATRRWPPKYECLKGACVGVQRNKKSGRDAKHYRCAACEECFPQSNVQVDHKEPVGQFVDWNQMVEKLFCEADNLQVLCKPCHKKKSAAERKETIESKKESRDS